MPDVDTLLRFAAKIPTSIEALVVGQNANYDQWRRDQIRHGGTDSTGPSQEGDPNADARVLQAKIKELEEDNQRLRDANAVLNAVLDRIDEARKGLALSRKAGGTGARAAGHRGRH